MWIIDKDRINDQDMCREGVHSRDYRTAAFEAAGTIKWRVKDDDGEIYYEGRMTLERLNGDGERAFGPLDFAMADAGATSLEYLQRGAWQVL